MYNPTASHQSLVFLDSQLANTDELIEGIEPGVNMIFLDIQKMASRKVLNYLPHTHVFAVSTLLSTGKLEVCNRN